MKSKQMHKMMGHPGKRGLIINLFTKLRDELVQTKKDIERMEAMARENAMLQRDMKKMDPENRAKTEAKLRQDEINLHLLLTKRADSLQHVTDEGKEHHLDVVADEYPKMKKALDKLRASKKLSLDETFDVIKEFGRHNVQGITAMIKGKILRFKGESFHFGRYLYAVGGYPEVYFAEFDRPVEFSTEEHVAGILDAKVKAMRRGLVEKNDVLAEHVVEFIANNRHLHENDLLNRLARFRIKSGMNMARIDNLDMHNNLIHYRGYPVDVWIPIERHSLEKAIRFQVFIPKIQQKLKETYEGDIEHVIQGVDNKGNKLTDHQIEELAEYGLSKTDISTLKMMHKVYKISDKPAVRIQQPQAA